MATNAKQPRALPSAQQSVDDAAFLTAMGKQVRDARRRRGMARKQLSREANVSERYLAQLEGGTGNASILLLRNVARALGIPVTELLDHRDASVEQRLVRRFLEEVPNIRWKKCCFV